MTSRAKIEEFSLSVCAVSGDPGCLDCTEGRCEGLQHETTATFHRCAECNADDVYGEICHEDTCSHATEGVSQDTTNK